MRFTPNNKMEKSVTCPACGSDQTSAQTKGFSAGKAVVGVVSVGSIGAVAGLHGSNRLVIHCLKCGHVWNPIEERANQNHKRAENDIQRFHGDKRAFYNAYESDDLETAARLLPEEMSYTMKHQGIHAVYKELKSNDKTMTLVYSAIVITVLLVVYWVFG